MSALLTVCLALLISGCVPAPSDPVDTGTLCLPSTADCPSQTVVSRDAVGRNQLDYAIQNLGTMEADVTAVAYVPESDVDAGGDASVDDAGQTSGRILIAQGEHRIPPAESVGNRWTPQLLGTRNEIEFSINCSACEVTADYVLTSVPLECSIDDDCSSGWLCDTRTPGRCVECLSDDDCMSGQTCDIQGGRCTPPAAASCSASGGLVAWLGLLFVLGFRRRYAGAATTLTFCAFLALPAHAAPPVASLGVGVGTQMFTGDVGTVTDAGLSLSLSQELRWQYLGVGLGVNTSYFLTNQPSPPFSRDLRTVAVLVGPRGYIPVGPIELALSAEYMRMGLDSNSLIRITGPALSYDGFSFGAGLRYRWSGLEVRLDGVWQTIVSFPGDIIGLQLGIAVSAGG
ncbi:MAG: hypothetical protein R3E66_09800 [bacterium]